MNSGFILLLLLQNRLNENRGLAESREKYQKRRLQLDGWGSDSIQKMAKINAVAREQQLAAADVYRQR